MNNKPCPFCGCSEIEFEADGDGNGWHICQGCFATGPRINKRQDEGDPHWDNRPAALPASVERVPDGFVLVPKEPEQATDALLQFMSELHRNVPDEQRPMAWMDYSEEQRERIFSAYRELLRRQAKLNKLNAMLAAAPAPDGGGE